MASLGLRAGMLFGIDRGVLGCIRGPTGSAQWRWQEAAGAGMIQKSWTPCHVTFNHEACGGT
jgi:hypothetical protein